MHIPMKAPPNARPPTQPPSPVRRLAVSAVAQRPISRASPPLFASFLTDDPLRLLESPWCSLSWLGACWSFERLFRWPRCSTVADRGNHQVIATGNGEAGPHGCSGRPRRQGNPGHSRCSLAEELAFLLPTAPRGAQAGRSSIQPTRSACIKQPAGLAPVALAGPEHTKERGVLCWMVTRPCA